MHRRCLRSYGLYFRQAPMTGLHLRRMLTHSRSGCVDAAVSTGVGTELLFAPLDILLILKSVHRTCTVN